MGCYVFTLRKKDVKSESLQVMLDPREGNEGQGRTPVKDLEVVQIKEEESDKTVRVSSSFAQNMRAQLETFLKKHIDVFSWSHEDMPGIDPKVIAHRLTVIQATS